MYGYSVWNLNALTQWKLIFVFSRSTEVINIHATSVVRYKKWMNTYIIDNIFPFLHMWYCNKPFRLYSNKDECSTLC